MTSPAAGSPGLRLVRRVERRRARKALFNRDEAPVRVGRFELRRVLGRGASGVVFEARDPELAREVAIKVIDARSRHRAVTDEARLLAAVSDPNVVPVFEVGTEAGATFVVMELVSGKTLQHWLMEDDRSVEAVQAVFLDAARGLAACHRRDIVHGDFKPANVMIGDDGRARVVDFGLAVRADHRDAPAAGTPSYMAPEQLAGEPASTASDVFSFCMALYRALGGPAEPDISALDASMIRPRSLASIVQAGLRLRPEDRPADAGELVAALEAAARPRPVWPWLAAAAVMVVGVVFSTGSSADPRFEGVPQRVFAPGAPTILWVDDNPRYNAEEIAELHRRGYNVLLALSLEKADLLGSYGGYAMVISDLERRDDQGFDDDAGFRVIRRVRTESRSVPVVLYTAERLVPVLTASVAAAGGSGITGTQAELLSLVDRLAARR